MEKGIGLYEHGEYQKSIGLFLQCVPLAKKEKDKTQLANVYNNLGNGYSQTGQPVKALDHYQMAIKIAEQTNDKSRIAKTTKNIGSLYSEQKDFTTAVKFYEKAHQLALEINDSILVADCLNNEGVVLEQQNEYAQAEKVYSQALAIYTSLGDEGKISMSLNNLAIVYKYLENYPLSIHHYEEALKLSEKTNDQFMVAATLNNLGNVYALTGNYKRSLELCKQALEKAKEINATEIIIETYDGIAIAYENLHQYTQAIQYRKLYEEEKNRFINSERSGQLAEMQTKYDTEKKESEIKLLRQQEQIDALKIKNQETVLKKQQYWLITGGAVLLLLLVIGYFYLSNQKLKARMRQETAIKNTEEKERLRMARDIHDDLGSGLSKINFLSELITQNKNLDAQYRENAGAIAETSKKLVVNMRDLIWALNPENTTLPGLVARIHEYSSDYLEDFPAELKLKFPPHIPETGISKDSHREILMVVKESLNNTVKHSKASLVEIEARIHEKQFFISVKDNGCGIPTERRSGNGLKNMQTRIQSIGGTLELVSATAQGTTITVSIPMEKMLNTTLVVRP